PDTRLFVGGNNRVPQAIFGTPEIRQMYLRRVRTLMDELLKPPDTPAEELHYEPRIDELAGRIAPDAALDAAKWNSHAWGNGSTSSCCPQSLWEAVDELKKVYLPERRIQLYYGLAPGANELPDAPPDRAMVFFGEIEASPASGDQDEEYIQLLNTMSVAVDISGWALRTGLETPEPIFTFRGGTVIPAGSALYLAASRPAFRARQSSPTGGQALFVVGDYASRLSARGETLELTSPEGVRIALANTPALPSNTQLSLRVTELMYNPPALPGDTFPEQEYEYVELKSIGDEELKLVGVHFNVGIAFDFTGSNVVTLGAGEHVLLVRNVAAFTERYGDGLAIAGEYTGYLDNGGESLRLEDAQNESILDFTYNDAWYPGTDGEGA
ncbi:MAG: hypothetical protein GY842_03020, partial [bacterium]|nr:hypothetical protein [bacterium]